MTFLSSHSAKSWFFTIYMGKPVGSRFGQIVRTIQDRQITSWNRVYHFYNYKSVPIIEKRPRKPETGIKDGFEEMEHEFSSVWSIPTANLPDETTQKIVFHLQFPTEFTEHFFVNFEQPTSLTVAVETDMARRKMSSRCTDSGDFLRCKVFNCFAYSLSS